MRNKILAATFFVLLTAITGVAGTVQRLTNPEFEAMPRSSGWTLTYPPNVNVGHPTINFHNYTNQPVTWSPGVPIPGTLPRGVHVITNGGKIDDTVDSGTTAPADVTQTVSIPQGIYDIAVSGWVRVYDDTSGQSRARIGYSIDGVMQPFDGVDNNGTGGWSPWTQIAHTANAQTINSSLTFNFRLIVNGTGGWSEIAADLFSMTTFANDSTITGSSVSFGRVMQNQTPSINLNLNKTGSDSTTYSSIATVGIGLSADGTFATGSETIGVQLQNIASGSAATGAKNYTVTVDNLAATGVTGSGQGVYDVDDLIGVSATVVANRTISASAVNLGNVIVGATSQSANSSLTTSGDDNNFTRVTVNGTSATDGFATVAAGSGQLFNEGSDTASRSVSGVFATAGPQGGSVPLSVSGEGLAGESVNGVSVAYTASAYDPSSGAFASNSGTTLNVDLGTFVTGSGMQFDSDALYNILQTAGYTAELDFDTISGSGDTGILSTDLGNGEFTALAAGIGNAYAFNMSFDTNNLPGVYNATYELRLSDADTYTGASAAGSQLLTLNLTGTIEAIPIPEPASGILLVMALGACGLTSLRSRN